jgi:hypothetical protein
VALRVSSQDYRDFAARHDLKASVRALIENMALVGDLRGNFSIQSGLAYAVAERGRFVA